MPPPQNISLIFSRRTNGRACETVLRLSVSVCRRRRYT